MGSFEEEQVAGRQTAGSPPAWLGEEQAAGRQAVANMLTRLAGEQEAQDDRVA